MIDIADRKRIALEPPASQDYLRAVLDSVQDAIFVHDAETGRIIDVNARMLELYGYTREEALRRQAGDFSLGIPPYTSVEARDWLRKARDAGVQTFEWISRTRSGRPFWVEMSVRFAQIGGQGYFIVTAHDIAERKRAEAAIHESLLEAERLAQLRSDFLANMSHEIRTPLNAVLGLAQLGLREDGGRRSRDTFARILEAGQHLLGVVNDILDFSKIEAGKLALEPGPMVLGRVIDGALNLIAARAYAKGLELRVEEAPDVPEVCQGDALRLSQILVNLLANAIKFTERGQVTLRIRQTAGSLVFAIEDTGIGMSQQQLRELFEPFHQVDSSATRRFGGTGLGLAISRRLVALMNGTLEVESQPDRGSTFTLRIPALEARPPLAPVGGRLIFAGLPDREAAALIPQLRDWGLESRSLPADAAWPAADLIVTVPRALTADRLAAARTAGRMLAVAVTPGLEASLEIQRGLLHELERPLRARQLRALLAGAAIPPAPSQPRAPRLAGLRILAAEDHEVNRLVLDEVLASEGARLDCFANGRRLLEHLEQNGDRSYALLLTDIQMPELNGYEAARVCRRRFPGLPVVGLTAHAMDRERERCLAAGMVEHVTKPVDIERLVEVILRHARYPAGQESTQNMGHTQMSTEIVTPSPSSPSSHDTTDLIDWAGLEDRHASNPAFLERLAGIARRSQAAIPGQLRDAAAACNLAEIHQLAHGVKGVSGNLMAWPLHELARETDQAAREGRPEAAALTGQLAIGLEQLLLALAARYPD